MLLLFAFPQKRTYKRFKGAPPEQNGLKHCSLNSTLSALDMSGTYQVRCSPPNEVLAIKKDASNNQIPGLNTCYPASEIVVGRMQPVSLPLCKLAITQGSPQSAQNLESSRCPHVFLAADMDLPELSSACTFQHSLSIHLRFD